MSVLVNIWLIGKIIRVLFVIFGIGCIIVVLALKDKDKDKDE